MGTDDTVIKTDFSRLIKPVRECDGSSAAFPSVGYEYGDRIIGSIHAPVILVKYGDYYCPHCGQACSIVKQIQEQLGSQLCFVYRHFPLTQIHKRAQKAAEVAEIAAAQGKFWQMHYCLFEHQQALDDGSLVEYAVKLGLDISCFLRNLSEHVFACKVQADFRSGVENGVTGTPTFFINGVRLHDSWQMDTLLTAIEQARN
jgi:protein-disulfide isomerase